MMTKFVKHEPCPKCGSKDNLGVWDDGHTYCFGCHYYTPPVTTIKDIRPMLSTSSSNISLPQDTTRTLPQACVTWLKKYNLTNQEIINLDPVWSESTGLLIFPVVHEGVMIGWVGRRFKHQGSKYLIKGIKHNFTKVYGRGSTLVFTEDLISAVKVARVCATLPLFGTFVNSLPSGYTSYKLWLDKDKQKSSVLQCKSWQQYGYDMQPIITELDPKCYSTEQIKEMLCLQENT